MLRATLPVSAVGGDFVIKIPGVENPGKGQLMMVVHALDTEGFHLGLGQGRQKHGGQDRNDGDDHQQLNQRKCLFLRGDIFQYSETSSFQ